MSGCDIKQFLYYFSNPKNKTHSLGSPKDSTAFVELSKKHIKGESFAWGKAVVTVDAPAEIVLAWLFDYCSNERNSVSHSAEEREVINAVSPVCLQFSTVKRFPWPLAARQFISETCWSKLEDGSFVVTNNPCENNVYKDNHKMRLVRGEARGLCIIQNVGLHQCQLTIFHNMMLNGNITGRVMDALIPRSLKSASQVRETFARDDEIDRKDRKALKTIMSSDNELYSNEELECVEKIKKKVRSIL